MKFLVTISFIFAVYTAFGQLQKCGYPTYYPRTTADNHTYLDTCSKIYFRFKRTTTYTSTAKWYFQGTFVMASLPNDSVVTIGSLVMRYSYQDGGCRIYNTTTESFWDWTGSSWLNTKGFNLDSLLYTNNTWTGRNRFEDSLTATKGIKSGAEIETKGLNTEGGANKAAQTINGVQKGKRRLITNNTSIDGTDFALEVTCTSADIEILLPAITTETEGWKFDIIRSDSTAYMVNFKRPDNSYIRILSKRAAILRNNGTQWHFD